MSGSGNANQASRHGAGAGVGAVAGGQGAGNGFEAPHASTVVIVDLLPGTTAYCDTFRGAPPILVVDTGQTEVQFSLAAQSVSATVDDLRLVDSQIQAWCEFKQALLTQTGAEA